MIMFKSYKTEINPTPEQILKIHKTMGVCRFIYNFYLTHNKEIYEKEKRFVSGIDFSKWLNNEFIPNNPEYKWIKDVSSKAVKQTILNGDKAFKNFFKEISNFPKFKKKKTQNVKIYLPKTNKSDWTINRHRIKIPTFGFIKIKEKGYIPLNAKVKSGTISYESGRYYVSVMVEEESIFINFNSTIGLGVDLGIKEFAVVSTGQIKNNINKDNQIIKIEKKIKREQRSLYRKYKNMENGDNKNIKKQIIKIQTLHKRIKNIREDNLNKFIAELVRTKPKFITIEDLSVKDMNKNKHLSKLISAQSFYKFRKNLEYKCKIYGIELRIVDRFYPSSKLCSCCGFRKKDLKLSDRIYICSNCGSEMDRDLNAAINLRNAQEYKIVC